MSEETIVRPGYKRQTRTDKNTKRMPLYNVILLNDDDHTYAYVVEMLGVLFGYAPEKSFIMAKEVDTTGRVVVATLHLEMAELKRDQIHAYGADWRLERSAGSMSAYLEEAPS